MKKVTTATFVASSRSFNMNKLQAVACIATSALCSIALITWAIRSFI